MTTLKKTILKVGEYKAREGQVVVTPERLKHFESQVKRLQDLGYAIPMHWNHPADIGELEPIREKDLTGGSRGAQNTVGKLNSFRVSEDGQSAEIVVETLTRDATEKASNNAVYVSPVIFEQWADGTGQTYSDIIGSVDLVDYPVDYSQSKFEPAVITMAIRLNSTPTIYRMSTAMDDENKDTAKDTPAGDEAGSSSSTNLKDVISALATLKIVLPEDTTPDNLLDRLHTALLTAAAQTGVDTDPDDNAPGDQSTVATPAIQTMSLETKAAVQYATTMHRKEVARRLDSLHASGRISDVELRDRTPKIGVLKLSLDSAGQPEVSAIEQFIESREAIPEGSFTNSKYKPQSVSQLRRMSVVEPPNGDGPSPERIDELVKAMTK